jgi:hypothetical protein
VWWCGANWTVLARGQKNKKKHERDGPKAVILFPKRKYFSNGVARSHLREKPPQERRAPAGVKILNRDNN